MTGFIQVLPIIVLVVTMAAVATLGICYLDKILDFMIKHKIIDIDSDKASKAKH